MLAARHALLPSSQAVTCNCQHFRCRQGSTVITRMEDVVHHAGCRPWRLSRKETRTQRTRKCLGAVHRRCRVGSHHRLVLKASPVCVFYVTGSISCVCMLNSNFGIVLKKSYDLGRPPMSGFEQCRAASVRLLFTQEFLTQVTRIPEISGR